MIKNKKGALELSVNTIVVIVIGITLLTLGLLFVRSLFERLGGQVNVIFGGAENEINKIATHDQKLSVPQEVTVKQGDQTTFKIWVVNLGETKKDFKIEVTPSGNNNFGTNAKVEFANDQQTLDIGEEAGFVAGVATTKNAPLSSAGYTVTVTANGGSYAQGGFFVKIGK